MEFTAEQMKKINEVKTAEELIELAKAEGIEMSEEELKAKFAEMHKEGELEDDELDNVAGGCSEELGDNQIMRIRLKDTKQEYDVISEGDDTNGHYVCYYDENERHHKLYDRYYEIVYTGAGISF